MRISSVLPSGTAGTAKYGTGAAGRGSSRARREEWRKFRASRGRRRMCLERLPPAGRSDQCREPRSSAGKNSVRRTSSPFRTALSGTCRAGTRRRPPPRTDTDSPAFRTVFPGPARQDAALIRRTLPPARSRFRTGRSRTGNAFPHSFPADTRQRAVSPCVRASSCSSPSVRSPRMAVLTVQTQAKAGTAGCVRTDLSIRRTG